MAAVVQPVLQPVLLDEVLFLANNLPLGQSQRQSPRRQRRNVKLRSPVIQASPTVELAFERYSEAYKDDYCLPKLCQHHFCQKTQPKCCHCVYTRLQETNREDTRHEPCDACHWQFGDIFRFRLEDPTSGCLACSDNGSDCSVCGTVHKASANPEKTGQKAPTAACTICLCAPPSTLFLPCAHVACCEDCASALFADAENKDGESLNAIFQKAKIGSHVLLAQINGHEMIRQSGVSTASPEKAEQQASPSKKGQITRSGLADIDTSTTKIRCPVCRSKVSRWLKIFTA